MSMNQSKNLLLIDEISRSLGSTDPDEQRPISLQTVLSRNHIKGEEMYKMQDAERVDQNSQILLVKRVDITFDDQECQMLTFVNITSLH